jgi:membrane AbrB-like protein
VALVQSVRVLLLTLLVPVLIALWGVEGTAYLTDNGTIALLALAGIFPLALGLGIVFKRFAIPAPLLLGGMAVSALGHGADLTPGAMPVWLTTVAFICMGSLIGTRFRGLDRRGLLGALLAGVVTTLIACALAALGAMVAAQLVGLPPAALLLAFAPGGVEVMAALAIETGLEPALVAAHHVFRLIVLTVLVPVMIGRARR